MSYQVLARKWRPQTFFDVVGQKHILLALTNSLLLGKIHHAYLLSGTRGVGKTSIARILAKGLNCENNITATPCRKCNNCHEIEQGCFIDLIEIDAASRTKIEDTRDLLDKIQYAPARGRFKVYLIDEVHMLSRYSLNALLKTLEEPPAHVKFLLATTDPQKLPATVLSRCLQFHLKALSIKQIRDRLSAVLQLEHITAESRALQLLAHAANGSMRDALNLADQAITIGNGVVSVKAVSLMLSLLDIKQPLALIEALANADGKAIITQLAQCAARGIDWDSLLIEMLSLLHHLAIGQISQISQDQSYYENDSDILLRLQELTHSLSSADLQLYYKTLLIGRKELPFAPNPRIGVEMILLRALTLCATSVRTTEILSNTEKKTAKFCHKVDQNRNVVGETITSDTACLNRIILRNIECRVDPDITYLTKLNKTYHPSKEKKYLLISHKTDDSSTMYNKNASYTKTSNLLSSSDHESLQDVTEQLVQARSTLLQHQENQKMKKAVSELVRQKIKASTLKKLVNISKRSQDCCPSITGENSIKAPRTIFEYKQTSAITLSILEESLKRDAWAAQVHRLVIPKLVRQLALNTWKENLSSSKICLHLRTSQRHLNSSIAKNTLQDALSADLGTPVKLMIIEDNNPEIKTPMEWRQAIYKEKLMLARKAIMNDSYIPILQRLFDAKLDKDSIQPI